MEHDSEIDPSDLQAGSQEEKQEKGIARAKERDEITMGDHDINSEQEHTIGKQNM